ncbi:hypothetical protein [Halobacillus naozhouensis]|uniref:Uncharacterized protein n=1 Tax=Halobacillus naozhouensis TaxID=554880 RepID=A0ABY8ISX7_9BACI|nr:hypothetical protein [Halobacillus naozhouensis]WFT73053.1 hypothetical protein P9989_11595 [Halobacillus naozhouensis]
MMILYILGIVCVYTGLMVWILAKLGLPSAQSVLEVLKVQKKNRMIQRSPSY